MVRGVLVNLPVVTTTTTSCRLQDPSLDHIGSLRSLVAFSETRYPLANRTGNRL